MSTINPIHAPVFGQPVTGDKDAPVALPLQQEADGGEGPRHAVINTSGRSTSSLEGQVQKATLQSQAGKVASQSAYDKHYWASQPPAVQQLQFIDDADQRTQMCGELIAQGYKIDVPIMMWGWDPQTTMNLRQSYGYTWVPSAMQDSIKIAPGLSMPGVASYDPANPPPDSIKVDATGVGPALMMSGFSAAELKQQFDPASFLNDRMAQASPLTSASVTNADGSKVSMNAALLAPLDQVVALQKKLAAAGHKDLPIAEQPPAGGARTNWDGETRRVYSLGGVNVGLMLNQLARYSSNEAMQLIEQELRQAETDAAARR